MKTMIKFEEAAQFLVSIVLFSQLPFAWWWFVALILLPDISMIGYMINTRWGAYLYNLAHHKGLSMIISLIGLLLAQPALILAGVILFGHACLDRMLGYGFKYTDSFKNTHLGTIGK